MLFDNPYRLLDSFTRPDQDALLGILDIMVLEDKNQMDNLGRIIGGLTRLDETGNRLPSQGFSRPVIDFIGEMSKLLSDKTMAASLNHSWIDYNGDTALIALMKTWNSEMDETQLPDIIGKMVHSGSIVHMRDRMGDTALAIAARRGLRPAVTALLDLGACVNCKNYLGVSILRGAR